MPAKAPYAYIDLFGAKLADGSRLKYLPIRKRVRVLPYTDELPARPLKRWRLVQIVFALWVAYSALMTYESTHNPSTRNPATQHKLFSSISMQPNLENQILQDFHYLSNLISPILVYIVEGYRLGNRNTILSFPSLFLLATQLKGTGLVSPIHAILGAFWSTPLPTRRFVKPEVARALILALVLGYVSPMMLILSDAFEISKWGTWVPRVYQLAPIFVCSLTFAFAHLGRIWNYRYKTKRDQEQSDFECYKAQDVPILKFAYLFAFVLQAMAHITLLVLGYNELKMVAFQSCWNNTHTTTDQTTNLFSTDLAAAFTTWFISNIYSVWDLRRFGYITTRDGLICALSVVAGQALVGPGATWVGLWYWREGVIMGLQRE